MLHPAFVPRDERTSCGGYHCIFPLRSLRLIYHLEALEPPLQELADSLVKASDKCEVLSSRYRYTHLVARP